MGGKYIGLRAADISIVPHCYSVLCDPDLAQQITFEAENYIGVYASDTSIAAVAEIAQAAVEFIKELVAADQLTSEQGERIGDVLARLEDIDPDSLVLCTTSVAQGFNLFHLIIAPAYALDGCEIRFRDHFSANLSVEEYDAIRAAIVAAAQDAILATLPLIQQLSELERTGRLTDAQAVQLANARGYLQQQMAYFELCSDTPGALRASGLIPATGEFGIYLAAAEAYRLGGDALAPHFEIFGEDQQQAFQALRRDNPQLFYALYQMQFGSSETLDAMFILHGVAQLGALSGTERDHALRTAASLLSQELFQNGIGSLSGVGGGKLGQITAAFTLASQGLSEADRLLVAGELASYANAHRDNVQASVATARIVVGAIFGVAIVAEAAPAFLACFADLVCRNQAAIAIGELAAGDALGPTTLAILPATGTLILRKGNEIIGFIDEVTGAVKASPAPGSLVRGPVVNPTNAQIAAAQQYNVDPRWVTPDGRLDYPPNDGFYGASSQETLAVGTLIDRYGLETGSYFSPVGTSFGQRSLPDSLLDAPYAQYVVIKPLPAETGFITPWFDQPGGGVQFKTEMNVLYLLDHGYIRKVGS